MVHFGRYRCAVFASMKVRNLKANHNLSPQMIQIKHAVFASMKVRNLKANHNERDYQARLVLLY